LNKVKIGMISFAHMHAESYLQQLASLPEVEIVGIADEEKQRVEPYLSKYQIPYFKDASKLLATDIQAVVICSENAYHKKLTIEAAKAGKHVLCEKPLGVSVDDMKQMIQASEENGVQLMTAFPCRYSPAVLEAKAAVERGEIGEILAIKGTNRGTMPEGWFINKELSGGGAVFDHTVHVMDLMIWFLQSRVVEVYAEAGTLFHDVDIDDAGMVHAKFENGVQAVLDPSWSRGKSFPVWGDVSMEIIGTEGVLNIDALAQKNELYNDEKMKVEWKYWGDNMDEWLIKDFVQSIREKKKVSITGEDGMKSAAVALAAYESANCKGPVKLSVNDWSVEGIVT
jgi:myo-inositol 2-dehydrogenase/D-chiro-inositol 1-dehydrogenase